MTNKKNSALLLKLFISAVGQLRQEDCQDFGLQSKTLSEGLEVGHLTNYAAQDLDVPDHCLSVFRTSFLGVKSFKTICMIFLENVRISWAVVAHAFNPSTQEARCRRNSLSSRPTWSTRASSSTGAKSYRKTLSRKTKKKKRNCSYFLVS